MTPTILVQFDPKTLAPTSIFYNGVTDTETARLREIVDRMLAMIKEDVHVHP